jgi:hypothetical protein
MAYLRNNGLSGGVGDLAGLRVAAGVVDGVGELSGVRVIQV